MDSWTLTKGRYSCFEQIEPYLQSFFNTSEFQKVTTKMPNFNLEETVEAYLLEIPQKTAQRVDKVQKVATQSKHFGTDKESIESKSSK
jgi:ABC-type enterochelin transport system substrate-binding protein